MNNKNAIYCSCCAKQAIKRPVNDPNITTLVGAVRGVGNTIICGHCAKELDRNGLFPEERTDEDLRRRYS